MSTLRVNWRGGIIPPGALLELLTAIASRGIDQVSFGNRQQLIVRGTDLTSLAAEATRLGLSNSLNEHDAPNVVSSYPAEEVFIDHSWISESTYKEIFDLIGFQPRLKVNISNPGQSFTPPLTGHLNWVADPTIEHFWHLWVRFPQTNTLFHWPRVIYTNSVGEMTNRVESAILDDRKAFSGLSESDGPRLVDSVSGAAIVSEEVSNPPPLADFNLPYYEGFQRYGDHCWLGIYRRDEKFPVEFLMQVCALTIRTRVGEICCSPWKSLIVKGIALEDRPLWTGLLDAFDINVRHGANELNFQIEDDSSRALALRSYLIGRLNRDDVRTFGVCIGIKTSDVGEVFSSILVRERPRLALGRVRLGHTYDILHAKRFNPSERTGNVFASGVRRSKIPDLIRASMKEFYAQRDAQATVAPLTQEGSSDSLGPVEMLIQCRRCLSVLDENGTDLDGFGSKVRCELCGASGDGSFQRVRTDELFEFS